MKRNSIILIFLLFFLIMLSGCWDYKELEERGIIFGVALDKKVVKNEHHEKESYFIGEDKEKKEEEDKEKKQYLVTLQLIEPTIIAGGEKEGFGKKENWNISTVEGNSIFHAIKNIDNRIYRTPFMGHTRFIIIGEELARDGITKSLDYFIRDAHIRKGTKIIVTEGLAKDVINLEHKIITFSGRYLSEISDNVLHNCQIPDTDLGRLAKYLHQGDNFLLPRAALSETNEEIKLAGAAVFKKDKMVGWLGEREVLDWSILVKEVGLREAPLSVNCPGERDYGTFNIELRETKKDYKFEYKNDKIKLIADIYIIADLVDLQCVECKMLEHEQTLLMENKINDSLENELGYSFKQVQEKFGIDIYMFGDYISKYHPKIWKEIKNNWDKYFQEMELEITVSSSLRNAGIECRPDLNEEKE